MINYEKEEENFLKFVDPEKREDINEKLEQIDKEINAIIDFEGYIRRKKEESLTEYNKSLIIIDNRLKYLKEELKRQKSSIEKQIQAGEGLKNRSYGKHDTEKKFIKAHVKDLKQIEKTASRQMQIILKPKKTVNGKIKIADKLFGIGGIEYRRLQNFITENADRVKTIKKSSKIDMNQKRKKVSEIFDKYIDGAYQLEEGLTR